MHTAHLILSLSKVLCLYIIYLLYFLLEILILHICLSKRPKLENVSEIMPPFIAIKYTSPNMHELCNMVGKEINASNLLNDCDTFGRVLMHQMTGKVMRVGSNIFCDPFIQ